MLSLRIHGGTTAPTSPARRRSHWFATVRRGHTPLCVSLRTPKCRPRKGVLGKPPTFLRLFVHTASSPSGSVHGPQSTGSGGRTASLHLRPALRVCTKNVADTLRFLKCHLLVKLFLSLSNCFSLFPQGFPVHDLYLSSS